MMNQVSELFNKIQARLTEAFNLVSDEAMGLAVLMTANKDKGLSRNGLTAEWRKDDAIRLAGHFYWLAKTYQRKGDMGRYIAFNKASKIIYTAIREDRGFNGKTFLTHDGIGTKVRLEAYQVWLKNGYTDRVQALINEGHVDPNYPAPKTEWVG